MTSITSHSAWVLIPDPSRAILQSQPPSPCLPTDPFGSRTATHVPSSHPNPETDIIIMPNGPSSQVTSCNKLSILTALLPCSSQDTAYIIQIRPISLH
ncbi:hypothetical protein NA56DRAFT_124834 [Hyaloscypha hepaticicola]|uniref:Uncharacterized protein n=1 Tax=Hyaloscypha hepaticicola TaxID=2082293 RepID=A0A2J6Q4W8_9HELO|nr:hypothetical protein NA56DRAFT_124834 [Hyaloscypha hepaticicola]